MATYPWEQENEHFSRLFHDVLQHMREQLMVDTDDLKEGIDTVKSSFFYGDGRHYSDVDYSQASNSCAFFYLYSQLAAELMEYRITQAMSFADLFRHGFGGDEDEVKVVILGGGAGADVVGFFSALYQLGEWNGKTLDVTLVEKERSWNEFFGVLVHFLREGDYGMASRMVRESDATLRFMCRDVAGRGSAAYAQVLQNADVIIVQRLISILPFDEKRMVFENIARNMKDDAVLLFIDSDYDCSPFGLEEVYNSKEDICVVKHDEYTVQGSPVTNHGPGIARKSKAHISVLKKSTRQSYRQLSLSP